MEFDLRNGFPLLTTKKMGWKTVLRELLWFISGSTDNSILQNNNVHIWDKNAKDFEKSGLYEPNDLGPVYGFQWRYFGGEYIDCKTPPTNGVDQIKYIIDTIKNDPSSRRLILSSWNPVDIPKMALPPCHVLVQFNIENQYIDAQLYQRSGDMFLGVPFNITSYSFLLHIIGSITGYKPRKLVHIIGDAHKDVSSFDSIAFISRDMMQFSHSVLGHNPNSTNPLKPVLSSGGENAPLLLGKTLFVYSKPKT